jgi:hypothetical protein
MIIARPAPLNLLKSPRAYVKVKSKFLLRRRFIEVSVGFVLWKFKLFQAFIVDRPVCLERVREILFLSAVAG